MRSKVIKIDTSNFMAGYVIGQAAGEDAEKTRQRRLAKMGEDQVLLHVNSNIDKVGQTVAKLFNDWEYKGGNIHKKDKFNINFTSALVAAISSFIIIFIYYGIINDETNWKVPLSISIAAGIIVGLYTYNNIINFIRLQAIKEPYTTVMIEKYDEDGYRNIDEDDFFRLIESLEDLYKEENEVKKGLNK